MKMDPLIPDAEKINFNNANIVACLQAFDEETNHWYNALYLIQVFGYITNKPECPIYLVIDSVLHAEDVHIFKTNINGYIDDLKYYIHEELRQQTRMIDPKLAYNVDSIISSCLETRTWDDYLDVRNSRKKELQ